LTILHKFVIIY